MNVLAVICGSSSIKWALLAVSLNGEPGDGVRHASGRIERLGDQAQVHFEASEEHGISNSEENRRRYRQMLLVTKGMGEFISGVILFDETIRCGPRGTLHGRAGAGTGSTGPGPPSMSALAILVGGGGASGINALGQQPGGPRLEWLGPGICAGRACAGEP